MEKFPRLPQELDRRKKLMKEDIEEIRELKKDGLSMLTIAKIYNVSQALICYWTNEKFREKVRKDAAQYKRSTEAIKRHKEIDRKSILYKMRVHSALRKYRKRYSKEYRERIKNNLILNK